jgi:hypothetical protein
MALKDKIPALLKHIEDHKEYLKFNKRMFDISEGALIKYVTEVIHSQIKRKESATKMAERIPSINILNKIVSKLSVLYSTDVKRDTNAEDLVNFYATAINEDLGEANKNFNRYKNTWIEIYEDEATRTVETRAIPSWQMLPYSDDAIDSTRMTIAIKLVGKRNGKETYWAYSADEFISFTDNGDLVAEDMIENEGLNPFGVVPFAYKGTSKNLMIPLPDTDLYQMTLLIPLLMSEINFGCQYLSMPIIFGVDIDFENDFSKNADTVMMLKSDPTKDKAGTLNVLQPNMNIDAQMKLVRDQLDIWLTTRDIRAGTIGGTAEADASGISLMIKNMDASKNIMAQANIFKNIENDLWEKLSVIHNSLADAGRIENTMKFPQDFFVSVQYKDNDIIEAKSETVNTINAEVSAGLKSKQTAIQELNPTWSPERVQEEMDLINKEAAIV